MLDLKGKRVTVMGLGRFGGGIGAARFLAERGARVTVTDLLPEAELEPSLEKLQEVPIEALHLGGHRDDDFCETDLVVVSPAVRRHDRHLQLARDSNVPLTSEMNLFWQFNRGRVVGVTGSNGKSTTAALIHSILSAAGFGCRLGGNIGESLLPGVDAIGPDDWSVVELSSFQLEDLARLPASPDVAVITNFSPNHLDWHGSLADYRRAKQTILRWQSPGGVAVLSQDDPDVSTWPVYGAQYWFGSSDRGRLGVFRTDDRQFVYRDERGGHLLDLFDQLRLPGAHNLQNAMAAVCAALAIGAPSDAARQGLKNFTALPHRLQWIAEVAGRTFYNDSLATTPESVCVALDSFSAPVVLIAGGYDKQVDLSAMADAIVEQAKAVALMGQTAEALCVLIEERDEPATLPLSCCLCLEDAFRWSCEQSAPGDVILLSPGCASYDWFPNFEVRGNRFVELVNAWRPK